MEMYKPLKDWELSCLAERMSPMEFDQIAIRYLEIRKVRLDQVKEDAGRNCITYMANALIMWRDAQAQNEARQLLYSKMTRAADQGLVERRSFRFLVTGEEDQEDENIERTWSQVISKWNQKAQTKFRSCPCCGLALSLIVPIGISVFTWVFTSNIWENISFSNFFDDKVIYSDDPSSIFAGAWITFMAIPSFLWLVFVIFESCFWCNTRLVRGQRPHETKRDQCRFICMAAPIACCYSGLVLMHFVNFYYIKSYSPPTDAFADDFLVRSKFLDRIQMFYQCCGVYNYTEWGSNIPFSCCLEIKPGCQQNISNIYYKSCLSDIKNYLNNEVRCQTFDGQVYNFFVGVFLLFVGVLCLYLTGKAYLEGCRCFKPVGRQADEREVLIGDNDIENPNNGDNERNVHDNVEINDTIADVIVHDEDTIDEELQDAINGNNGVDANENPQQNNMIAL